MAPVVLALLAGLTACHRGQPASSASPTSSDAMLAAALVEASGGIGADFFRLPSSDNFDAIPQDPKNPLEPNKVTLGQLLFHETALGNVPKLADGVGTYSCASCHHAQAGFQAGRPQAIAEGGSGFGHHGEGRAVSDTYPVDSIDVQPIRTPTTLNVAFQSNMLWNGGLGSHGTNRGTKYAWMPNTPLAFNRFGLEGVETQAIAALDVHRMDVETLVEVHPLYREMFDAAFPDVRPSRRYTRRYAGLAIAAYERTLLANEAPFQRWLRGERGAMTDSQKSGALLFFTKAKCHECHTGPALNSMRFEALGMKDLYQHDAALNSARDSLSNLGRGGFTGRPEHMHAFKVPQLYNLADAAFYGHGASFTTIEEVVRYKNRAEPENPDVPREMLSAEFRPLGLSEQEIRSISIFIAEALRDDDLDRYVPLQLPSGACFPNNDEKSRLDLGCSSMSRP